MTLVNQTTISKKCDNTEICFCNYINKNISNIKNLFFGSIMIIDNKYEKIKCLFYILANILLMIINDIVFIHPIFNLIGYGDNKFGYIIGNVLSSIISFYLGQHTEEIFLILVIYTGFLFGLNQYKIINKIIDEINSIVSNKIKENFIRKYCIDNNQGYMIFFIEEFETCNNYNVSFLLDTIYNKYNSILFLNKILDMTIYDYNNLFWLLCYSDLYSITFSYNNKNIEFKNQNGIELTHNVRSGCDIQNIPTNKKFIESDKLWEFKKDIFMQTNNNEIFDFDFNNTIFKCIKKNNSIIGHDNI
jgi:hypothetical protein